MSMTLTPQQVADELGFPVHEWPGNCYAVAFQMIEKGLVSGRAAYGHYLGEVKEETLFDGKPIVRHGWIVTDQGQIIDPTRWVFEGCEPYIHCAIDGSKDYDEGGNTFLLKTMRPAPEHDPESPQLKDIKSKDDQIMISLLLTRSTLQTQLTLPEAHWLATLPLPILEDRAQPLYALICELDWKAFIPYDNYHKVLTDSGPMSEFKGA